MARFRISGTLDGGIHWWRTTKGKDGYLLQGKLFAVFAAFLTKFRSFSIQSRLCFGGVNK
jgi:hypothetical protein